MEYFSHPQVICRKCGSSSRVTRSTCPICGSDLTPWKGKPLRAPAPAQGTGDLSERAAVVRSMAAKKGICAYCMGSFPADDLEILDDGSKICAECKQTMQKKWEKDKKPKG